MQMADLSLLVFDECHCATKKHLANMFMQHFCIGVRLSYRENNGRAYGRFFKMIDIC